MSKHAYDSANLCKAGGKTKWIASGTHTSGLCVCCLLEKVAAVCIDGEFSLMNFNIHTNIIFFTFLCKVLSWFHMWCLLYEATLMPNQR